MEQHYFLKSPRTEKWDATIFYDVARLDIIFFNNCRDVESDTCTTEKFGLFNVLSESSVLHKTVSIIPSFTLFTEMNATYVVLATIIRKHWNTYYLLVTPTALASNAHD